MNKDLDGREELVDHTSRSKPRILLAEDNRVNQKIACLMLEKAGFCVDVVEDGLQATEAVESRSYDLILMDCMMPGMDGYKATAKIRRMNGAKSRIPIIALTANTMMGDRDRCIEAGMDDFLPKPINRSGMLEIIDRWISFLKKSDAE
ncbi:MAG: response regulator [Bacteroidales bacterium]|nr:response regulator [Candidatus Latescibacterota bacterium]